MKLVPLYVGEYESVQSRHISANGIQDAQADRALMAFRGAKEECDFPETVHVVSHIPIYHTAGQLKY